MSELRLWWDPDRDSMRLLRRCEDVHSNRLDVTNFWRDSMRMQVWTDTWRKLLILALVIRWTGSHSERRTTTLTLRAPHNDWRRRSSDALDNKRWLHDSRHDVLTDSMRSLNTDDLHIDDLSLCTSKIRKLVVTTRDISCIVSCSSVSFMDLTRYVIPQ